MKRRGPWAGGGRYWASAALVVLFVLAPASQAGGPLLATDHPIHVPASLEQVATEYWERRGLEPAAEPEVFETDEELRFQGWAEVGGTRIWLSRDVVTDIHGTAVRRRKACALYIHERGHTAGLSHESFWAIMDPAPFERPPSVAEFPAVCWRWARHEGPTRLPDSVQLRRSE